MRREKGRFLLPELERRLHDLLDGAPACLVVQSGGSGLERAARRLAPRGLWRRVLDPLETVPRVVTVPHPLPEADYRELLRASDVVLFLYDPQRYAVRCSAVFRDARAAGVPVVVPAETWMPDELEAAEHEHGLAYRDLEDLPARLADVLADLGRFREGARAAARCTTPTEWGVVL